MKTLKFQSRYREAILRGDKTTTWRLFDDKDLAVGDKVELIDKGTMEKIAESKISYIREKKLSEIDESDYARHETSDSPETILRYMKAYYGDRVTLDTLVKIITFEPPKR
jgi:hypothetical protein